MRTPVLDAGAFAGRFATGVLVAWLIVEWLYLRQNELKGLELLATAAAGAVLASGASLVLGLLFLILRPLACRQSKTAAAVCATILALALAVPILDLFAGEWVSRQSWTVLAKPAAILLVGLFFLVAGSILIRLALRHGRIPLFVSVLLAAGCAACFLIDAHDFLARKYLAAHDILAVCGLLAAGIAVSGVLRFRQLVCVLLIPVYLLLGAGYWFSGAVRADDVGLREALLRDSRLSARVLAPLLRLDEDGGDIDAELLRTLTEHRPLAADELDARIPGRRKRDIVLITIDTLRHDALSVLGGKASTPHLDRFIEEGVVFQQTWSQFPSTRHAMNALFTGAYPESLGFEEKAGPHQSVERLPEDLAARGYATMAFTSFPADLFALHGDQLQRGFTTFENNTSAHIGRSELTVESAVQTIASREKIEQPLFLWVHLFDPHRPYTTRARAAGKTLRERYDLAVERADRRFGKLMDALRGLADKPLIVLHSDHGEEFRDHGGLGHNSSLYDEQIRVPLVFHGPGVQVGRHDHPAELLDIGSTVREYSGIPQKRLGAGQSLLPVLAGFPQETWPPPVSFTQFNFPLYVNGRLDAVREGDWKLIHDPARGLYELFHLGRDPGEQENVAAEEAAALKRMKRVLRTVRHMVRADRGADAELRLSLAMFDDPAAKKNGLNHLRLPVPADEELVLRLIDHEDSEVRRAALIQAAIWDMPRVTEELRARLQRGGERSMEAGVVLALLGDRISLDVLPLVSSSFDSVERSLHLLARYVSGDRSLESAIRHMFSNARGRPDLTTLFIQAIVRAGKKDFIPTLYARMNVGLWPQQLAPAAQLLDGTPDNYASPVVRRFLASPDKAIRDLADADHGTSDRYAAWSVEAQHLESELREAAVRLTRGQEEPEDYAELVGKAFERLAGFGRLDWGLALDYALASFSFGDASSVGKRLSRVMARTPGDEKSNALVQRMIAISEKRKGKVVASLEILPGQDIRPGEKGVVPLLVRVSLGRESSSLIGGIGDRIEKIGAVVLGADGQVLQEPYFVPVLLFGLLPGESALLMVPIRLDGPSMRGKRVLIRLVRGKKDLTKPVTMELSR